MGAPGAPGQVQDPRVHPLPPLRPAPRRVSQVRPVPDLPARAGPQRLHPRHDEVELVVHMSMTDPIADFLTRIRNGIMAAHETVEIPSSKLKQEMARILTEQGYIEGFEVVPGEPGRAGDRIVVKLKYTESRESVISGLRRISRPGRRTYVDSRSIPKVLGGMGTSIVSTSRGVMTGHDARKEGVGGELVAQVW